MTTKTTKITITKSTVKVVSAKDEKEFPRATKKDGRYVTPWDTGDKAQPGGWDNFKYAFVPNYSKVPSEDVSVTESYNCVFTVGHFWSFLKCHVRCIILTFCILKFVVLILFLT